MIISLCPALICNYFALFCLGACVLGLFLSDAEQEVYDYADYSGSRYAGDVCAEEGDVAIEGILSADSHNHDSGDDGNVLGAEHVYFFLDHDSNTLSCDRSEQEIGRASCRERV